MSDSVDPAPDAELYRWQGLFQRSREPVFLLNRRRQLVFVNHAWEQWTGVSAAQAVNLLCKRSRTTDADALARLGSALAPPPAVRDGQAGRIRRLVPLPGGALVSVEIDYLPLNGANGLLGVLGKLTPRSGGDAAAAGVLPEKLQSMRESLVQRYRFEQIPAESPAMQRVIEQARLASHTRVSVLLLGERGSGKLWLARAIHHQGDCRDRTFVALDCAGLPATAVTAAIFGPDGLARRGGVGTVFLGHVNALPREVQVQMCDWLGEPETERPRVIASVTGEAGDEVQSGRLVNELSCSLATIAITLPPLRERRGELSLLVQAALERVNAERPNPIQRLTPQAWEAVRGYAWPGNLRELTSVLVDAAGHATGEQIDVADFPAYLRRSVGLEQVSGRAPIRPLPLKQLLEQVERRLIELALRMARGKKGRAARILAIWRPLLLRRMKKLGIPDE